jgi:AraC family transcriptional regulator, exoenzyme S synthesis regulatory protein ExsA
MKLPTLLNALDLIRALPSARTFEVGGLLFARFTCPMQDQPVGIWAESDHFIHVLTAQSTWKTFRGTWSATAGETVFFRKGAYISPPHVEENLCLLLFFVPDAIVRETVHELAAELPRDAAAFDAREIALRVNHDLGFTAFLHAMTEYFSGDEPPPEPLLKLKLKELITSILVGHSNPTLAGYFRSLGASQAPAIEWIMEANFRHNLSIEQFAQLCHRSISTFKRDFREQYHTSPGKWLLDRRLECAASLLRTTDMSVTETMLECGFEDLSHFSRTFKERFGEPPSTYRTVRISEIERPAAPICTR